MATGARVVLGYAPLPAEIDILPYLETRAREGVRTLLPRMEGQALTLHDWHPGDELERGPFGVREPRAGASRADAEDVELALVPGVGFDRVGHRLGFGRGFYDRLLRQIPLPLRVGVAFDAQVVDRLPAEDHDQRVAWLIVAGGLTHFKEEA